MSVTLTLIPLSDIEVMVSDSKQVFRLHRAVLWARSEWFRALIDRWSHAPRNNASTAAPMELSVMSGDVLACVVEYLYTGCGGPLTVGTEADRCAQSVLRVSVVLGA